MCTFKARYTVKVHTIVRSIVYCESGHVLSVMMMVANIYNLPEIIKLSFFYFCVQSYARALKYIHVSIDFCG